MREDDIVRRVRSVTVAASVAAAAIAGAAGCGGDGEGQPGDVCVPGQFGASVVALEMPAEAIVVPADDRTLLVWHVPDPEAGFARLHARCVDADGAPLAGDAVLPLGGFQSSFRAARRDAAGGDGAYDVIVGVYDPTQADNPKTLYEVELDCDAGWSTPRLLRGPEIDLYVSSAVRAGSRLAFTTLTTGGVDLWIRDDDAGADAEPTIAHVDDEWRGSRVLWNDDADELAVMTSGAGAAAATTISTFALDGSRRGGPTAFPAGAAIADACWDGDAWATTGSLELGGRPQVVYARYDVDATELIAPTIVSGDAGDSYYPSLACGPAGVTIAWQRNTGGSVPGSDLNEAVIGLVHLDHDLDPAVLVGPIDLEPASGRISMLPVIGAGGAGERVIVSWASFGANGYEQRLAASAPCD